MALNRYDDFNVKNEIKVRIEERIFLEDSLAPGTECKAMEASYDLQAIISHEGETIEDGKYFLH